MSSACTINYYTCNKKGVDLPQNGEISAHGMFHFNPQYAWVMTLLPSLAMTTLSTLMLEESEFGQGIYHKTVKLVRMAHSISTP
jgi:hypothetical protein